MKAFAVITSGGKQYKVTAGTKLNIEKITTPVGGEVTFDKVLLSASGEKVDIGTPYLKTTVSGKVLKQDRDDKKTIFKYSSKSRFRRRKGHRQYFTQVEITKI